MKKIIIGIFALVVITLLAIGGAKAAGLYYTPVDSDPRVASSTAVFVIGGTATTSTTKVTQSDGQQQISYLLAIGASTTPPTICWTNQYSNNGTDWYTEMQSTSTITHLAAEKKECILYATTTADTFLSRGADGLTHYIGRRVVVPNLDTTYTRTIFSVQPGTRARIDIRRSLKNEVILQK